MNKKFITEIAINKTPKIESSEYSFNKSIMVKILSNKTKHTLENQNTPLLATTMQFSVQPKVKSKMVKVNHRVFKGFKF